MAFLDMDILTRGAVVQEAEAGFNLYWNSRHVKAIDAIYKPMKESALQSLHKELNALTAPTIIAERINAAIAHDALTKLRNKDVGPYRGRINFFCDHPDKIDRYITGAKREALLLESALGTLIQKRPVTQSLEIANAYLILEKRCFKY